MPGPHRSIDCAARAYKAGQKLAPRAANVSVSVTTRKIGGGLGSPFGPAGPGGPAGPAAPCGPGGHVRHWVPPTLVPCLALRALRSDGARWAEGPAPPRSPTKPCGPTGSLQTLSTLRTRRSDEPLRASFAQRPGRTSPPWCTTATRHGDKGGALGAKATARCAARPCRVPKHTAERPRAKSSPHCASCSTKVGRTCLVTAHYDRRRGSSSSLVGLARICLLSRMIKAQPTAIQNITLNLIFAAMGECRFNRKHRRVHGHL